MLKEIGAIIGTITKPVTNLIDSMHTSEEEKQTLKLEFQKNMNILKSQLNELLGTIIKSKTAIMKAELNQDDKYTKRARPTIAYTGLAVLMLKYVILPYFAHFTGHTIPEIEIPAEFWYAWGGVTGVYSFRRTEEKISEMKNVNKE